MSSLWLVDSMTPKPYTFANVDRPGLGGTERMLAYVGQHLAGLHQVVVFQQNLMIQDHLEGVSYKPLHTLFKRELLSDPSHIVVINSWKLALKIKKSRPLSKVIVWLHVFPGKHNRRMGSILAELDIQVICVSNAHKTKFTQWCQQYGPVPKTHVIHNMIAPDFINRNVGRDPNQLLFASSPHKGLKQTLSIFEKLRAIKPSLHLTVCSPGYLKWDLGHIPDQVNFLNTLKRNELSQLMSESLCLFYPQTEFEETFGMVIAEANACGLPTLVHRSLGANAEVVSSDEQLIDGNELDVIVSRITQWQQTLPEVSARPQFLPNDVLTKWKNLMAA